MQEPVIEDPCRRSRPGSMEDAAGDSEGPPSERPRERLDRDGPSSLAPRDLVALVLGTGVCGLSAEDVADMILAETAGLEGLSMRAVPELARLRGVGAVRAARLVAAVEMGRRLLTRPLVRGATLRNSADVYRHYQGAMRDLRVEQFRVVLLDGKHRFLREELISQGTLTSSPVHPREVFGSAVRHAAAAVVLVHNHPSGDPAPSADDLEITRRLCEAGDLLGIRVIDHVIVGDGAFTSLADRGLLR